MAFYGTVDGYKAHNRVDDETQTYGDSALTRDSVIESALEDASRHIDRYCHRTFNVRTRRKRITGGSGRRLFIDDLSTDTGLTVRKLNTTTGAWEDIADTNYEAGPFDIVNDVPALPYTYLDIVYGAPDINTWSGEWEVNGTWGWPEVPEQVVNATYETAALILLDGGRITGEITAAGIPIEMNRNALTITERRLKHLRKYHF